MSPLRSSRLTGAKSTPPTPTGTRRARPSASGGPTGSRRSPTRARTADRDDARADATRADATRADTTRARTTRTGPTRRVPGRAPNETRNRSAASSTTTPRAGAPARAAGGSVTPAAGKPLATKLGAVRLRGGKRRRGAQATEAPRASTGRTAAGGRAATASAARPSTGTTSGGTRGPATRGPATRRPAARSTAPARAPRKLADRLHLGALAHRDEDATAVRRASAGTPERRPANRPPADPRLRARQAEVRRAAGRRRLKVIGVLAAVAGLIAGVLALLHSSLLAARTVHVNGALHETRAEVLAVTGLGAHPPLIDIAPGRAAAALERLPWVQTATVARDWPTGATVTITERHALGAVALGAGRVALVDGTGRVLADVASRPLGLAPLRSASVVPPPGGTLARADAPLLSVARALPVSLVGEIDDIALQPGTGVVLQLHHGPLVVLGSATDLAQKMTSLVTLHDRANLAGIRRVDLRVGSAPVLTP